MVKLQGDGDGAMQLVDDKQVATGGITQLYLVLIRIQVLHLLGIKRRRIGIAVGVAHHTALIHILVDTALGRCTQQTTEQ